MTGRCKSRHLLGRGPKSNLEQEVGAGFPQSRACGTAWPESRSSELPNPEVDAVLGHLPPPCQLVGTLLYGCGLRLSECLELRIQRFNLDGGS